jgi:hypothetical protein
MSVCELVTSKACNYPNVTSLTARSSPTLIPVSPELELIFTKIPSAAAKCVQL